MELAASAAATASKKPMPKIRTLLRQLMIVMSWDIAERGFARRRFRRTPEASAHHNTESDYKDAGYKKEHRVPAIWKSQKRQYCDKGACGHQ